MYVCMYVCMHMGQPVFRSLGNHFMVRNQHHISKNDIAQNFEVFGQCQSKLMIAFFLMLFTKELESNQ